MDRFVKYATVLFLLGPAFPSQAASFDCNRANSKTEKLVCANPDLSQLDEQLSKAYKKTLAYAASKDYVRQWQTTWLIFTRDYCEDTECLKKAYALQIGELGEHADTIAAISGVSGKYNRYHRGKLDKNLATLIIIELENKRIRVMGDAVWVGNAETGSVNTGEISGLSFLAGNKLECKDSNNNKCSLLITFHENGLSVKDENLGCGGLNVSFDGEYRKIGSGK